MKIDDDVFEYLQDLGSKLDDCIIKIVSLENNVSFIKDKVQEKKSDFKFQFGLLWSAIGVIFIALVGLTVGKLI